jgi:mono/diheme cytochrome c family protein
MVERALILCLNACLLTCAAIVAASAKGGEGDAEKGKAVFAQQCVMCHNATTTEKKMGPGLKGVFKKDKLANGKKATEQNVRAQIENGGNGMPAYKDMLSEEERNDLIAYLKTL